MRNGLIPLSSKRYKNSVVFPREQKTKPNLVENGSRFTLAK